MANPGIVERDLGYVAILRQLAKLDGQEVAVGLHADGTAQDGVLVAQYGAINEFGSEDGRIPERSFMRGTFDRTVGNLNTLRARLIGGVMDGKLDAEMAGSILGEKHQQDIQATIASSMPPPNAPSTVRRKKSSGTLIDTGLMRNTVRYVVESGGSSGILGLLAQVSRLGRRNR